MQDANESDSKAGGMHIQTTQLVEIAGAKRTSESIRARNLLRVSMS